MRIAGSDAFNERTRGHVARNDCRISRFQPGNGSLRFVEPQAGLELILVGTVTEETVVRKDRPNVAVELNLAIRSGHRRDRAHESHQRRQHRTTGEQTKARIRLTPRPRIGESGGLSFLLSSIDSLRGMSRGDVSDLAVSESPVCLARWPRRRSGERHNQEGSE